MTNIINFKDRNTFRDMTRWFSPTVLFTAARQVVTTNMFSSYSDRRLTEAALDDINPDDLPTRHDFSKSITSSNEAFWIDYVADLGDGFNSTYSIASLLAKKSLKLKGLQDELPRGKILIMGGDEVYPAATQDDYKFRMEAPYRYAFPHSDSPEAEHPSIFAIPGNHDWYDGLSLFLGKFCAGKEDRFFGSWKVSEQHRSYFSVKLPHNWWIWGFDSQVEDTDIDMPQSDYFTEIAKRMPENAKIILCASVPSWLKADLKAADKSGQDEFFKSLGFIANIAKVNCPTSKIPLIISGDTHHYNRYSNSQNAAHFITSGGGGAFLHPTHNLPDRYSVNWLGKTCDLSLKTNPQGEHEESDIESCYPKQDDSRDLAKHDVWALYRVPKFCGLLGFIYWALAACLWPYSSVMGIFSMPLWILVASILCGVFYQYADASRKIQKTYMGVSHGLAHFAGIILLTLIFSHVNGHGLNAFWSFYIFMFEMTISGALLGPFIWGCYLSIVSTNLALHKNDAFSALGIEGYKNFLRIKVEDNQLTIYPIGLDKVPNRNQWMANPEYIKNNQNEPFIKPAIELDPHLIEGPVIIQAS